MKLLILLTVVACFQVSARGHGQTISITLKDASLETAFKEIKRQSGYSFIYTRVQLKNTHTVNINVSNADIKEVLELCFRDQPLSFVIEDLYVIVKTKSTDTKQGVMNIALLDVRGIVRSENGEPAVGITVTVKGTNKTVATNDEGEFILRQIDENSTLQFSGINVESYELSVRGKSELLITLKTKIGKLDELHVIAYGVTTQRYNVGSVTKISSEELTRQPVTNPLAALEGKVPGMVVTATSGIPGASFKIQIRGQNSLNAALNQIAPLDQPLFIIDGVPFAPQNTNINLYESLAAPGTNAIYGNPYGGISPFNNLDISSIESIEVLRDADATAIYGSRGANGVVIVTTKKGKPGKATLSMNIFSGISQVTKTMPLMNTREYIAMRKQAFSNDGLVPNTNLYDLAYAPDLLAFDTTRDFDWKKYFLGKNSQMTNVNTSFSGGTVNTRFLIGAGFRRESYIFPGDFKNDMVSSNLNLHHNTNDHRISLDLSIGYSYSQNNSSGSPSVLTAFTLPPDYPSLLKEDGNLNWEYNGIDLYDNPLSYLKQKYSLRSNNLIASFQLRFQIIPTLAVLSSFGYNSLNSYEKSQVPTDSQDPTQYPTSYASFGNNEFQTLIAEPQIEYKNTFGKQKVEVLTGATFQKNTNLKSDILGYNFSNDNLLGSISAANEVYATDGYAQYKYSAAFARINFISNKKYIVNLTGRRDGSSRFGPGRQFGNFGSVGAGWIFSEETFIKKNLQVLSYGKLRLSYGSTGNDNIGDYQYLSRWAPTNPYQGINSYLPQNLYNPDFSWATTRKLEGSLELGFSKDRVLFSITAYRHRSSNQLITYSLPSQTGFTGITSNFPALVQNAGIEIQITSTNIKKRRFSWNSTFNLTLPRNKLISFPGIENTPYSQKYIVGESLNGIHLFRYLGVNDSTGVYMFESGTGPTNTPIRGQDYRLFENLDPKFHGGLANALSLDNFQLYFFFQFAKQTGPNYLQQINAFSPPGTMYNQPRALSATWTKITDQSDIQKYTSNNRTAAGRASSNFATSDAAYSDASYIRLKTISLSYTMAGKNIQKLKLQNVRVYLNAQNLLTITNYKGNDPETQSFYSVPPLKTIVAGLQLTF